MHPVVATSGLTKFYGKTCGIENLDLEVRQGEIFGFIGPNGAGKSTTLRLLLDFIRPTRGSATVLGLDAHTGSIEIRSKVGYIPGELALFPTMTGRELVEFLGALRGVDVSAGVRRTAERLELDLDRKVKDYSSGNRQKLALVQAFMHDPELLILDEPTSALDPLIQQEFYRMLDEVRSEGRTVFLSSHVLPEVERVADRVGIIRNGHLVTVKSVQEMKQQAVRRIEFRLGRSLPEGGHFADVPSVLSEEVTDGGRSVTVLVEGSVDAVIKRAAKLDVTSVVSHDGDLEEAFLSFYGDSGDAA